VQTGHDRTEIMGNVLTFLAKGGFTQVTTVRSTLNGVVTTKTFSNTGTYTADGTAVTYRVNGFSGPPFTGIVSGSTFTVGSAVYRKQ